MYHIRGRGRTGGELGTSYIHVYMYIGTMNVNSCMLFFGCPRVRISVALYYIISTSGITVCSMCICNVIYSVHVHVIYMYMDA